MSGDISTADSVILCGPLQYILFLFAPNSNKTVNKYG
jgi:hypothetical protein